MTEKCAARYKTVDFNSVLMGLNLVVAGLVGSAYSLAQNNDYIDQNTILLGLLLSLQTHIALQVERVRRDPFVILLSFVTILYYSLRLYTLALYGFSNVFERYSYGIHDSNFALGFIIVANLFLYAGFFCVRFERNVVIDSWEWRPTASGRIVALMIVSLIYSYWSAIFSAPEESSRIVGVLSVFITPPVILLMALSYFVLFRKTLDKKVAIVIGTLLLLEIAVHSLSGSRGGIVTLFQNIMMAVLAISGAIKFRRGYFILGCMLAPIGVALLIGTFAISTFSRVHREGPVDLGQSVELANQASTQLGADTELELVLPPIFDRAGYFDFSAEIIAHTEVYKDVFSMSTYAESIVDNLLTPGFDIFDQPKVSTSLQFVYGDYGNFSKVFVSGLDYYHSDQFGMYGELYALCGGYASLPLFFLVAFLMKRIYVRLRSDNPFALVMKRVIVLSVFLANLNSYGMDWTIIEAVPFVVAIYLYKYFFRSVRLPVSKGHPRLNDPGVSSGIVPSAI